MMCQLLAYCYGVGGQTENHALFFTGVAMAGALVLRQCTGFKYNDKCPEVGKSKELWEFLSEQGRSGIISRKG